MDEDEEQKEERDQKEEESEEPSGLLAIPYQVLLAHMLRVPIEQARQVLHEYTQIIQMEHEPFSNESFEGPVTPPSETDEEDQPTQKRQKIGHIAPTKEYYREYTEYKYLLLSSGREFYFHSMEDDLLTPLRIEPNPFIRKLLCEMPSGIQNQMRFLSDFMDDDENIVVDVDRIAEKVESEKEVKHLDLATLFTNLREQLITAYLREIRLRRAFRNLLQRWRNYHMDKKYTPEVDPITLSPPEKEVIIYDRIVKKKFIFEARSLANYIETKLAYNEGGFAAPIFPKNPWSNADFTYYQLLSIYSQLKHHGELRWGMTTLQKYHFDLNKWHQYHRSTLTLQSIKNSIRLLDSVDARDILEDFILLKLEDFNVIVSDEVINAYRVAMRNDPDHWYLQYWKEAAWIYYEAEHFSKNRTRWIDARCEKIIRHHRRFLNELVERKWIRPLTR